MPIFAFGINHTTAPVHVREKVAFAEDSINDAVASIKAATGAKDSVILSTCNRTEIYANGDNLDQQALIDWLAAYHSIKPGDLGPAIYMHEDDQAVKHLMRVASGLDSLILGEPQILGQVKQAFTLARHGSSLSSHFERLFQHTFEVAKRVRAETEIGANAVSVAYASVQLAKHIFASLKKAKVLMIGAGETIDLVSRYLREEQVAQITVANRTLARAKSIAEPLGGEAITLSQIPYHLADADLVFSSTASQLPIVGKGVVESALKERRHKPMFLVDLAVPRDIEAEVGELDDAYLYAVDDLQQIVAQNIANRQNAAAQAEALINNQSLVFDQWQQSQVSIDRVKHYRQQSQDAKNKLKERALNQLQDGKDAAEVIEELANKLTNTLVHGPTTLLKQAAEQGDEDQLAHLEQALGFSKE